MGPLLCLLLCLTAAGEEHWSLRPVTRPAPPAVADEAWCANPIDRFVLARLEAHGLTPAPEADRASLARRLDLVLLGLPPTPEEIDAYLADERPDAWARRVEAALASPHYGERWARHWLDVARFAETHGFETNTPRPNAWPYRDWVIRALDEDRPYDQFMLAQVAGDTLGEDPATGFLVAGPYDTVKSPDEVLTRNQRQDELTDVVNAASTAFLGLTVACARCHDHKFDPLTQRDFYAMQAIFAGVQHGERPWRAPDEAGRLARVEDLRAESAAIEAELAALAADEGAPPTAGVVVIDDEDARRVELLIPKTGHGVNPAGAARGQRDDPGDLTRLPNLSRGRYTWWNDVRDEDVLAVRPGVHGRYRVWLSWGAGWDTHTPDAHYSLVRGGERTFLTQVDQREFADGVRSDAQQPLWSGLRDVGVHRFEPDTRLVLRSGVEGRPVTADVLVLVPQAAGVGLPTLRDGVDASGNQERFAPVLATALRFEVTATVGPREPCLDELEVLGDAPEIFFDAPRVNLAPEAAEVLTSGDYAGDPKHRPEHVNDGRHGNGRSWISDTPGAGWVELRWAQPVCIDGVRWARDREGVYRDRLARDYTVEVRIGDGPWRVVAAGADRLPPFVQAGEAPLYRFAGTDDAARVAALLARAEAARAELAALETRPSVYAGLFEEPAPTHLLYRGDPMEPREPVAPDVPAVLGSLRLAPDASEAERRLAFGRWLGDPANPLTARVIVNRLWAHHFGTGLVATPSDLGAAGGAPSHPALLDWLAAELVDSGWSLKHVQRLIVGSRTWRQSTRADPAAQALDAHGRLLWRFPPRRVEAEVLRDGILAVAGVLDRTPGGPGFSAFEPNDNYVRNYVPRASFASDGLRRMVYMTKVRMERDATFGVFDTPDAGMVCPVRGTSTTPLQALALFNSPFVLEQAERLAARIEGEVGADPAAQVRRAFRLALGRWPAPDEGRDAADLVARHGLAALGRVLFNSNEFAFLP